MKRSDCTSYYLPPELAQTLGAARFGKLTPFLSAPQQPEPYTLLDTVVATLCASQRLLFRRGQDFELVQPDGGVLGQPAEDMPRFIAGLKDGPVRAALAEMSPLRSLLAVGSGTMQLADLSLTDDEGKTRARAEIRYLESGDGGSAALVLLRGMRGYDKDLDRLRRGIVKLGATEIDRGSFYSRLFPTRIAYDPKPQVSVGRDEAAFDAATDIISTYLPVARANERGAARDRDTEFLHDYRIALRKIRSVLSLFKGVYDPEVTETLQSRFSGLMQATDRLRDLDVYLLEKQPYYDMLPDDLHPGLDGMFALYAAERAEAQANLVRHFESEAYRHEMAALAGLFAWPDRLKRGVNADRHAHDYACALIWKRYRKIRKMAAGIDTETDDAEIHALRIQCKKLRYLMEFFAPVFPKNAFRSLLGPLKTLQDDLGVFNDFSVQQDSLAAFLTALPAADAGGRNAEIARSVEALIAALRDRQAGQRGSILESLGAFAGRDTERAFRKLFHDDKEPG